MVWRSAKMPRPQDRLQDFSRAPHGPDLAAATPRPAAAVVEGQRIPQLIHGELVTLRAVALSAEEVRNFCLMATTVIPVLVLARFLGSHSALDSKAAKIHDAAVASRTEVGKTSERIAELQERATRFRTQIYEDVTPSDLDLASEALAKSDELMQEIEGVTSRSAQIAASAERAVSDSPHRILIMLHLAFVRSG